METLKIIEKMGFVVKTISPIIKCDEICNICNENIISHIAIFDCKHISCTNCLDILTDDYNCNVQDILFNCPLCFKNIKNIVYQ